MYNQSLSLIFQSRVRPVYDLASPPAQEGAPGAAPLRALLPGL